MRAQSDSPPVPASRVIDAGTYRVVVAAGLRHEYARHIVDAAPAHHYAVVSDADVGVRSGTSFAAPLVSAAVWLRLQTPPGLAEQGRARVEKVAEMLGESASTERVKEPPPKWRGRASSTSG